MSDRERKLTTIVAIDVAAYSRLMHADETGTLDRLRAARAITDPIAEAHGARLVGTWGDGLLVEFPSVVQAVEFACKAQAAMAEFNEGTPEDQQLLYRIGINLGDVIIEDGDLFGDGVNVAARLEALAPAGGIVLSRSARDQVLDKLVVEFEDLGEVEVKNIARPVRAFRVLAEGEVATAPPKLWRWRPVAAALVALLLAFFAGGVWWSGILAGLAEVDPILALPEGPKIVVLPFDNLSGDPQEEYFVDGLVEDLTTRLTEHGFFYVIARNSAFKYKGKSPDIRDVGRDLGVDYVVEGSVRKAGGKIRVNAQLLNADDGTHIWARTYERDMDVGGVFTIQDELTTGISRAIGEVRGVVSQRILREIEHKRPKDLAAYECSLLSWSYWESFDPGVHAKARDCLEEAVGRDPKYAQGWANLSHIYRAEIDNGANPRPNAMERMIAATNRAVELDPNSFWAHLMRGVAMRTARRKEDALQSIKMALTLSPNHPRVLHIGAWETMVLGDWDRAKALWKKVSQLDPAPPSWTYFTPMLVHYDRGELAEAYQYALTLGQTPMGDWHWVAAAEAGILAEMGRGEEATVALSRALSSKPDYASTAFAEAENLFWANPKLLETFMNGLYKAGLPKVAEASN